VTAVVTDPASGPQPPSGVCNREPSQPTNFRLIPGTTTLTWEVLDPGGPGCMLKLQVRRFDGPVLYEGASSSFTLPTITCNSGYFVGAANQEFPFRAHSLWLCPQP
jgi:hypothetical protein